MKLGQAEAVGVFDDHDRGVGDVDSHLDDRGRDQQGQAAVGELGHHRLTLGARHLAMGEADLHAQKALQVGGAFFGGGEIGDLALGHKGADPVGLRAAFDGGLETLGDLADAHERHDGGGDRRAAGGLFGQAADVELPVLGQLQGPGDGGGRHGQQMDAADAGIALGLKALALVDAETVLFVDHGQSQAVEADGVLEQGVGADGDLSPARGEGVKAVAPLGCRVTSGQQDGRGACRLQHGRKALVVLAGQDLGGGH